MRETLAVSVTGCPRVVTWRWDSSMTSRLVADIAHELRTPVTILQGGTEELLDGIAGPNPGKLTWLHDETLCLGRLVDDLATLAAAQAAGLTLHKAPVDLGKTASGTAAALAPGLALGHRRRQRAAARSFLAPPSW